MPRTQLGVSCWHSRPLGILAVSAKEGMHYIFPFRLFSGHMNYVLRVSYAKAMPDGAATRRLARSFVLSHSVKQD